LNKEIQIPTSWSDSRITVRLNKGNKAQVSPYIYVVDSTGAVNAQGFRIGTSVTTPRPATDVRAN